MSTLKFGYISFGGFKLFVAPEDYSLTFIGSKSQPIVTSTGVILDVGYGFRGFQAGGYIPNNDGSQLNAMEALVAARLAADNPQPITVLDTVYPGGKSWTGFFELPMIKTGTVDASAFFNLPSSYMMDKTTLNFYSTTVERF